MVKLLSQPQDDRAEWDKQVAASAILIDRAGVAARDWRFIALPPSCSIAPKTLTMRFGYLSVMLNSRIGRQISTSWSPVNPVNVRVQL
jgi:hypothetical protein